LRAGHRLLGHRSSSNSASDYPRLRDLSFRPQGNIYSSAPVDLAPFLGAKRPELLDCFAEALAHAPIVQRLVANCRLLRQLQLANVRCVIHYDWERLRSKRGELASAATSSTRIPSDSGRRPANAFHCCPAAPSFCTLSYSKKRLTHQTAAYLFGPR
jgi:hypothetical protein